MPDIDALGMLKDARGATPKVALQTVLAAHLPKRVAQMMGEEIALAGMIGDASDKKLAAAAEKQEPTGRCIAPGLGQGAEVRRSEARSADMKNGRAALRTCMT